MKQISQRIRSLRLRQGMTQEELAHRLGYTDRSSIAKLESGRVDLSQTKLKLLSEIFSVPVQELLGLDPLPQTRQVPILGTIACGAPILAQEHIDGYTQVPTTIHADFALVCKGDSMINARIFDGDLVYIRQQNCVENGEIAAVLIDGEATLKRVRYLDRGLSLEPENPMYRPLVLWEEDMNRASILGKAVAFTSLIR